MSAHPGAFSRLANSLRRTKDRKIQDELLDKWLEYRDLATDWDAEHWGFLPDRWMVKERKELARNARFDKADKSGRRLDRGAL